MGPQHERFRAPGLRTERLVQQIDQNISPISKEDTSRLLQALQTCHIELKMKNDALVASRAALEKLHVEYKRQLDFMGSALEEEREKARAATGFMNEFLSNVSHEIRTPLAGVIGFAEVLEEELHSDEHREVAQLIAKGGNRLLDTLNSVLDFARLRVKTQPTSLAPTNVKTCVLHQCKLLAPQAAQRNLNLDVHIGHEDIFALADPILLERIIYNLISNAIKYTEKGRVALSVYTLEDWIEIRVSDTGVGIKEDFLPYVFEPFRQEQTGDARPFEGIGLGLSVTRRLVELMKGEIEVTSKAGAGSTFTVRIRKPKSEAKLQINALPRLENQTDSCPFDRCKILVVEDNWETLYLVKRILKPVCDITAVQSFDEAVKVFQKEDFNIVLIDVNLGEKRTGTDLLHYLRALPETQDFCSIAFTAYSLPADHAHFLSQGFDDYLPKPFTKADLLDTIERASLAYA